MIRVILAGILGGVLAFFAGAFNHMVLELEGRAFQQVPEELEVRSYLGAKVKPGLYTFPAMKEGYDKLPKEERDKEFERVNELYKQGPAGILVIAPTGEDMMGRPQLIGECVSNVLAALVAACILVCLAPGTSYPVRWVVVLMLGLFTWLSTSASFAIWYRFPWEFILDGLYGSLIEWGVAGLAIAAIARPAEEKK